MHNYIFHCINLYNTIFLYIYTHRSILILRNPTVDIATAAHVFTWNRF